MAAFIRHELVEGEDGFTLVLYLDPGDTEFSKEFDISGEGCRPGRLDRSVREYIKNNFRNIKISMVKIMAGTVLVAALHLAVPASPHTSATASATAMSPQSVGFPDRIVINGTDYNFSRQPVIIDGTTFVPVRGVAEALGCEVWWNGGSKTVGITRGDRRIAFTIGADHAFVNGERVPMQPSYIDRGTTMVPLRFISECLGMDVRWDQATKTAYISSKPVEYVVKSGDTLWKIAAALGTTAAELKKQNGLASDMIYPGQKLYYTPAYGSAPAHGGSAHASSRSAADMVSHIPYMVVQGDTAWNISVRFGIPMHELLAVNGLKPDTWLSVGQKIMVPVHRVPVKETPGPQYGEYLDWWTEAQYVFPINKVAVVTDFETGRKFRIKRTIGANHADCEPLTAQDAAVMKQVWGGAYSWKERAVIIEVDGRRLAASMSSMPHGIEYITGNNFSGHFDVHFRNSTRHADGLVTAAHQEQVRRAAGVYA